MKNVRCEFLIGLASAATFYVTMSVAVMLISMGSAIAAESSGWWFDSKPANTAPPSVPPYHLPSFSGEASDLAAPMPALHHAPGLDADALFSRVVSCFPAESTFKVDVSLKAAARTGYEIDSIDNTDIGRHYLGIVATMPLYSSSEIDRRREREFQRRTATAQMIGSYIQAVAARNHARREIGLYSSLESRARLRVAKGLTDTSEQVRYLEKVAKAQASLVGSEAAILQNRLAIVAQCESSRANGINRFLKAAATLPRKNPDYAMHSAPDASALQQ